MFCKIWTWIGELKLLYSGCRKLVSKKPRVVMGDKDRAYVIGQRAASGHNIYLTFGSEKLVLKMQKIDTECMLWLCNTTIKMFVTKRVF